MNNNKQPALLSVNQLHKTYASRDGLVTAIDHISLEVKVGETVALVGESGCGKSTVAATLLGLLPADSGQILVEGRPLPTDARERGRSLSMVFQNPYASLNPKMTIKAIVAEPLKVAFGLRGSALHARILTLLGNVGMGEEHMERYPHEFSGGQLQRIAIARALALESKLLILDEPTAALDVSVQAQVLQLLKTLQTSNGLSYLFISHDLATVEYLAQQVLVMYLGRIVEAGPVEQVFGRPRHPYTRALLNSVPSIDPERRDQLQVLSGEIPSPLNRPAGCHFAPRCPRASERCRREVPVETQDHGHRFSCHHPLNDES
ncbi:ABC transporter ATP-binding protein [Pseudomonas sp. Irchel s3b2]|uniref:ABC transporter ATP-binding protein n=1 Tax=Pseudomonas sp. Irchel s3b2 TaxID=2009073 RepID=UPI000BA2F09F|nr:oligopeptide/dipeptide ABC transporter ATP-binding protein [Pseudomonas sp. Irchel s3b2]